MSATITTVWVTSHFTAFHNWPDAPNEVKFLRQIHRHVFHVRLEMCVMHHDRDLEFFILKNQLDSFLAQYNKFTFVGKSCEMFAQDIYDHFNAKDDTCVSVSVSEDNENGSTIQKV